MSKGFRRGPTLHQEIELSDSLEIEARKLAEPYEWAEYDDDGEFIGMSGHYVDFGDPKPEVDEEAESARRSEREAWRAGYDAASTGLAQSECPLSGKLADQWRHGWKMGYR
jgi:hypothetical protein